MPKILQLRAKIVHWKKTLGVDPLKLDTILQAGPIFYKICGVHVVHFAV